MNYSDLMKSRFCDVIATEETGYYKGDEYFILCQNTEYDTKRYGFGTASYGSCSGCDELEAAYENGRALNELADEVYCNVRWFDSKEVLIGFLQNVDKADNWYANEDEWPKVLEKLISALNEVLL